MQEPILLPPPPTCEHKIPGCAKCPAYRQMYMYWKLSHPEGQVVSVFNGCKVQIGPLGEDGYYCKIIGPDSVGKWHVIKKVVDASGYDNILLVIDGMNVLKYSV